MWWPRRLWRGVRHRLAEEDEAYGGKRGRGKRGRSKRGRGKRGRGKRGRGKRAQGGSGAQRGRGVPAVWAAS